MRLLVVVLAGLLSAGCGGGDPADWGPLAVIPPQEGGGEARTEGTVRVTGSCLTVDGPQGETLPVWPKDRTSWDAGARGVEFVTGEGEVVDVRDGDRVVLTGTALEGGPGEDWASGRDWVARPAEECGTDRAWVVVDVEMPPGG